MPEAWQEEIVLILALLAGICLLLRWVNHGLLLLLLLLLLPSHDLLRILLHRADPRLLFSWVVGYLRWVLNLDCEGHLRLVTPTGLLLVLLLMVLHLRGQSGLITGLLLGGIVDRCL